MMDLDKFKSINDTYGHDTGDRVLAAFAKVLKGTLRHEDAIARLGGDEFVALLPGIAKREATEIANRILRSAEAENVACGTKPGIPLVVSIGICDNANAASEDAMFKAADQAMYLAKNSSGNCCVEWSL
jgi:diguanylate cyclase (GGDEF)-like protein